MSTIQELQLSVNLLQAILWQYDGREKIMDLVRQKQEFYGVDYTTFWEDWIKNVFNLTTANLFGLAVWSIILNLPLFVNQSPDLDKPIFGFNENLDNGYKNFDNGNFSSQDDQIYLTLEQQRLILRLRYYQLISRGAIPETNKFLKTLFADYGKVILLDGLDMSITYVFYFVVPSNILAIIEAYDLLPRPAGVMIKYFFSRDNLFGFNENLDNNNKNFDNGNFYS